MTLGVQKLNPNSTSGHLKCPEVVDHNNNFDVRLDVSLKCPEIELGTSLSCGCAHFRIVAAAAAPLVFFTYGYDRGPDDVRATIPTITTATTMAAATW